MMLPPLMEMELRVIGVLPPPRERDDPPQEPRREIDGKFNKQWVDESGEPTF